MKTKLEYCSYCNEETLHDIGKKEATTKRGAYKRRTTRRCRYCGTKEIRNIRKGKTTTIKGQNLK